MKEISLGTLEEWIRSGVAFQLIDVREPEEHALDNIGGLLIPLDEIMQRSGEILSDGPVVFYCKRGIRSQIAIQRLSRVNDSRKFYNLTGGIYSRTMNRK